MVAMAGHRPGWLVAGASVCSFQGTNSQFTRRLFWRRGVLHFCLQRHEQQGQGSLDALVLWHRDARRQMLLHALLLSSSLRIATIFSSSIQQAQFVVNSNE